MRTSLRKSVASPTAAIGAYPVACRRSTVRYWGPIPLRAATSEPSADRADPRMTGILLPPGAYWTSGEPCRLMSRREPLSSPTTSESPCRESVVIRAGKSLSQRALPDLSSSMMPERSVFTLNMRFPSGPSRGYPLPEKLARRWPELSCRIQSVPRRV